MRGNLGRKELAGLLRGWADDAEPRRLILHDWFGSSPVCTPAFLKANLPYLDTLPFDGVALYMRRPDLSDNVTMSVMSAKPLGHDLIASVLAPVRDLGAAALLHNFAAVISKEPPDFFDDAGWAVVAANFGALARAALDAGLEGVYFDNETYFKPWANYPEGVMGAHTLKQCQDQASLRGRQVMQAMEAAFPRITVVSLHGPYVSRQDAPAPLFPQWQSSNELMGPLFDGMLAGTRTGTCVDGGELYHLRTDDEFTRSYHWRKAMWPSESVAFGVHDKPFGGKPMTPGILRTTLRAALGRSDRYVWLYVEGPSFLKPAAAGGAPDDWLRAVRDAAG